MRLSSRFIAVILTLVMILGTVSIYAMNNNTGEPVDPLERVAEVKELREKNADTYRLADGRYECVIYTEDKYYENAAEELVPIDNSIVRENNGKYTYQNAANSFKVYFGEGNNVEIKITNGKDAISFVPYNAVPVSATIGGQKNTMLIDEFSLSGENYIAYKNIYEKADLVYSVHNGAVKEYIVLNDRSCHNSYTYEFDTERYKAILDKDGRVIFVDSEGDEVFRLGDLFAVDSDGTYTDQLHYEVDAPVDGKTKISIVIDASYLNAPERVFPVVIDPFLMITGEYKTYDTFVSSLYPTTNYYLYKYLRTGVDSSLGTRRTFIKFDIPSSLAGKYIDYAYINIRRCAEQVPTAKAYKVTSSWSSSSVTWNAMPSSSSTAASYGPVAGGSNWYRLYIESLVEDWISGSTPNYGVVLKEPTEANGQSTVYYSSDAASPNKPELDIIYYYDGSRPYQAAPFGGESNCMGYALEYKDFIDCDDLHIVEGEMNGCTTEQMLSYIEFKACAWMNAYIGSSNYSQISNYYSDINDNCFRVVLRVGFVDANGDGVYNNGEFYDYHWMYETNESGGPWANKHGHMASNLISGTHDDDPTLYSDWTVSDLTYNSSPLYYSINDIRTVNW